MRKGTNEMVAREGKEMENMEGIMEEVKEMVKNEMEGVDMNFAGVMDVLTGMKKYG